MHEGSVLSTIPLTLTVSRLYDMTYSHWCEMISGFFPFSVWGTHGNAHGLLVVLCSRIVTGSSQRPYGMVGIEQQSVTCKAKWNLLYCLSSILLESLHCNSISMSNDEHALISLLFIHVSSLGKCLLISMPYIGWGFWIFLLTLWVFYRLQV